MDRPGFHAGMAPNGYLEVWSGLLLRVGSEAELAFVLGHEIGHVDANHPVEQRNALKTRLGAAMAVGAVASAAGAYYAVDLSAVGDMARHGAVAASDDYSLAQEIEADRIGFERLVKAGYDPGAAADLWRSRQDDGIAADRVTALETLGAASPEGWRRERDAWRAAIRPHLAGWLADDLRRRDFEGALALTARLERDGMDAGVLGFHRGEIYRLRREEGDAERARDAYLAASGYTDAPVAVWRELGDVQARLGRNAEARAAWRTYLERAPTAEDRWIVEDSLAALGGS
nr:M48 family metallopeptidase [Brevundimonas lenta]